MNLQGLSGGSHFTIVPALNSIELNILIILSYSGPGEIIFKEFGRYPEHIDMIRQLSSLFVSRFLF